MIQTGEFSPASGRGIVSISPVSKSLAALAFGTLGMCMSEFSMMGVLSDIAETLGTSIPEAGHFIAAYALGVCAGAPLTVLVAHSRPLKSILLVLMIFFVGGNLFTALAPNYPGMLAARFLSGLPHGAYFGVAAIVADTLVGKSKAVMAVAVVFSGATIANLAGVPGATLLGNLLSWRYAYGVVAGLGVLIAAGIALWVPRLPGLKDSGLRSQFHFLKSPIPWLLVGAIMLGNGGLFCWYSYINPMMTRVAGFSSAHMTPIMALAGLGMVLGNMLSGRLSARFPAGGIAAATQGIMCAALAATFFGAHIPYLALALMTVCTASMFALSAPEQMLLIRNSNGGEMLGAALAQVGFNIGNAIGAFCGGLTIQAGFGYPATALTGACLALGGFSLLIFYSRRYGA